MSTTISAQQQVDQLVYRLHELMPAHAYQQLLVELQDRGRLFFGEGFLYTENITLHELYRFALEIALEAEPEPNVHISTLEQKHSFPAMAARTEPIVISSIRQMLPEGHQPEELMDFIYELVEREWLFHEEDGSWSVFTDLDLPGTFRSWFGYPTEGSE